jgi:signal transduction histidine kinase
VLTDVVRSAWAEPRPSGAPKRVWRDWALVGVLVPTAVLEGALRSDVIWRPVAIALALLLVWPLLWRRTKPLAMLAIVFGALIVLNIVSIAGDTSSVGLYTSIYILLLPYALVRWGSGREILLGLPIILVTYALGIAADYTTVGEAIGGVLFGLFPAVLGAAVRFQVSYRGRERDQVKLQERAELARELHDTVAHHVSAIAIRAQAGRVVAATDPDAAIDALRVIENEASRALTEMRLMVGALRDGDEASLVPQPGVSDIERLARSIGDAPRVTVALSGDLDDLQPSVGAAVYRLAQESITNAVRHARHATRVDVSVEGQRDYVRLTVADDGDAGPAVRGSLGYGLVGMTERATILGGTLDAGPGAGGGWTVSAVLPRTRALR